MVRSRMGLVNVLLGAFALTASACIADETDPNVAFVQGDGQVTIVMDEFSFTAPRINVDAGATIKLTLVNEGSVDHELMIGQGPQAAGGYGDDLLAVMLPVEGDSTVAMADPDEHHDDEAPATEHHDDDETATEHHDEEDMATEQHDEDSGATEHHDEEGMDHAGAHVTVEPGQTIELLLTVPADAHGEWELGCFIDGHYEDGMKGSFTVRQSLT